MSKLVMNQKFTNLYPIQVLGKMSYYVTMYYKIPPLDGSTCFRFSSYMLDNTE